MKLRYTWMLTAGILAAYGQNNAPKQPDLPAAPTSFDASGAGAKPATDDPAHRGETPNPQLLGMEIPLMDPSNDTVSYNGCKFDVGNNAMVRARFEKYLQQSPDDSSEAKRYRKIINQILKETDKAARQGTSIGSKTLSNIGKGLREASAYPADADQSKALSETIQSVLISQRGAAAREEENARLDAENERMAKQLDVKADSNVRRKTSISVSSARQGAPISDGGQVHKAYMAEKSAQMGQNRAKRTENAVSNAAARVADKTHYQALLVHLLMSRRFDHVVIGARVYRHVFKDGDVRLQLQEDSKASDFFSNTAGLPPTVNVMDSLASSMRRDVDQNIEAVHSLLAQNKLAEATQRLIEALAVGEYMESVTTFPTEARQRIAQFWTLRKRAFTALNARDYDTVEDVARKMKDLDADFDDSLLLTYTTGKKRQSDLAIRNATKALRAGNEEDFNRYITEAGTIWPRNPNLDKGAELLTQLDEGDPAKEEFRNLYEKKEFRRIVLNRERLKIVALDPELAPQYEEAITLVMKMDGMLEQIRSVAQQDAGFGPCMAYEKMIEWQKEDDRFAEDVEMRLALKDFESKAHDFVQALRDAATCEERREFGSALSCYYRAQCKYPHSDLARQGIARVMEIIVNAEYN